MMLETEHFMEELYQNFRSNYTPEYPGTSPCVTEFESYHVSGGIANLFVENTGIRVRIGQTFLSCEACLG